MISFLVLMSIVVCFSAILALARLRKTAAGTRDAVCDAIAHILDTITATECRNYLLDAGYDRT